MVPSLFPPNPSTPGLEGDPGPGSLVLLLGGREGPFEDGLWVLGRGPVGPVGTRTRGPGVRTVTERGPHTGVNGPDRDVHIRVRSPSSTSLCNGFSGGSRFDSSTKSAVRGRCSLSTPQTPD